MKVTGFSVRSVLVAATLTVMTGGVAQALPAAGTYDATTAGPQAPYTQHSANHALWLPGIPGGSDFVFAPGAGTLTITNGASSTMKLTGSIRSVSNPAHTFDVSIDFQHYSEFLLSAFVNGTPQPKKELSGSAYAPGPGGIDPSTWDYYVLLELSFLMGTGGALDGIQVDLTQRPETNSQYGPYLSQIGYGANNKNLSYGLSTWFNWSYTQNGYRRSGYGDVNIDLEREIPEPASLALFGLGLVGLGIATRRRRLS